MTEAIKWCLFKNRHILEEDPQKKDPGLCMEHRYVNKRNIPKMKIFKFGGNSV